MEKPKLSISFSGGRSSAVMTRLCLLKYRETHEISVVFANTGCEHPATLDFVNDCDVNWGFNVTWIEAVIDPTPGVGVRHKIVTYETASRKGEPFEAFIAKYGIPNATTPCCTSRLKEDPMKSYRDSLGWFSGKRLNFKTAIGIRADEIDRQSDHAEELGFIYPLIDAGIDKAQVNQFMAQVPWDLKLKSDAEGNCVWCWKKSDRKLYTLALESPEYFEFPAQMERKYGDYKADSAAAAPDGKRYFFRGHRSTSDLLREAKEKKFRRYRDQVQGSLFEIELDQANGSCTESCEIGHH